MAMTARTIAKRGVAPYGPDVLGGLVSTVTVIAVEASFPLTS